MKSSFAFLAAILVFASSLCAPVPAHAAPSFSMLGPSITIGGRVFTDLPNLKVLYALVSGSGTRYSTFKDSTTAAAYQVPSGKSFYVYAYSHQTTITLASSAASLGYADNDVGFGTTVPTNQVDVLAQVLPFVAAGIVERASKMKVPALKYPSMDIGAGGSTVLSHTYIYGYEE